MSDGKGSTPRQTNILLEKAGTIGSQWRPDPVPLVLAHVWGWYRELHGWRRMDDNKSQRLSHIDLHAWMMNTGTYPSPFELDTLRQLEDLFFYVLHNPQVDQQADMASIFRGMATKVKAMPGTL